MFLYVFLEKTKLKNVSSNDADLVRDLRFILIAAQKNYVLNAPLGDRPIAGADADVMNVWLAQYDDYLIVLCTMLYGLEPGLQKRFWNVTEHMICSMRWNWYFRLMPVSRGMRPLTSVLPKRWRRIAQLVSMCSECLSTTITWIKWELIFQIR